MAYITITETKTIATEKKLTQDEMEQIDKLIKNGDSVDLIKEYLSINEHEIKDNLSDKVTKVSILNIDFGEIEKDVISIIKALEDFSIHSM